MNNEDRVLLEKAARAAGAINTHGWSDKFAVKFPGDRDLKLWNPLEHDGDALRLSVKLKINLQHDTIDTWATTLQHDAIEQNTQDAYKATRRAIVRAAAALVDGEEAK